MILGDRWRQNSPAMSTYDASERSPYSPRNPKSLSVARQAAHVVYVTSDGWLGSQYPAASFASLCAPERNSSPSLLPSICPVHHRQAVSGVTSCAYAVDSGARLPPPPAAATLQPASIRGLCHRRAASLSLSLLRRLSVQHMTASEEATGPSPPSASDTSARISTMSDAENDRRWLPTASTLGMPSCRGSQPYIRFALLASTRSRSTSLMRPTPIRAIWTATADPTPPTPTTHTSRASTMPCMDGPRTAACRACAPPPPPPPRATLGPAPAPPPCRSSTLPTMSILAPLWMRPLWPTAASIPSPPQTMLASGLPSSAPDTSLKKRAFAASSVLLNPAGWLLDGWEWTNSRQRSDLPASTIAACVYREDGSMIPSPLEFHDSGPGRTMSRTSSRPAAPPRPCQSAVM